jgi:hypothetical protein
MQPGTCVQQPPPPPPPAAPPPPPSTRLPCTDPAGQTISVDFLISTVHQGRVQMRLCPEGTVNKNKCITLYRSVSPAAHS